MKPVRFVNTCLRIRTSHIARAACCVILLSIASSVYAEGQFVLRSSAFKNGGMIPARHTCEGENISPPLTWHNTPEGGKSYLLVVEDPDAPFGRFIHWIVFDIPARINAIPESFSSSAAESGAVQGNTGFRSRFYGGPCPPHGDMAHRYYFIIRALDVPSLGLAGEVSIQQVENAVHGHLLGEARLLGLYKR